jgi:hypothetical protein
VARIVPEVKSMMKRTLMVMVYSVVGALPLAASAQATYEPQRRLRTALDMCIAGELMQDAYCVKKCQPGFTMELAGKRATCVATRADSKYKPPAADDQYKPPPYNPGAPSAPRSPGA